MEVSYKKKVVLENFTKFAGKHLCLSLFFNKVADLRPATLLKKRLWHSYFPVNFVKFLRTPFLQNTSGRLLLNFIPNLISKYCFRKHCVKSVQIRSFLWSVFSRIWTEYGNLRSKPSYFVVNLGKY